MLGFEVCSNEYDPGLRVGYRNWTAPSQAGEGGLGSRKLGYAGQERETACWGEETGCDRQDGVEAFDCGEGYDIKGLAGEGFSAGILYIDVRQCKGAADFTKESRLLVIRFDQSKGDLWGPEFDGDAGESGAGADVSDGDFLSLLRSFLFLGD